VGEEAGLGLLGLGQGNADRTMEGAAGHSKLYRRDPLIPWSPQPTRRAYGGDARITPIGTPGALDP
jgi:hypothetical protein